MPLTISNDTSDISAFHDAVVPFSKSRHIISKMKSVATALASKSNITRSSKISHTSSSRFLSPVDKPEFLRQLQSLPAGQIMVDDLAEVLFVLEYYTSIVLSAGSDNDRNNTDRNSIDRNSIDCNVAIANYSDDDIARHEQLKNNLTQAGYRFIEAEGNYGTLEKSLIVLIDDCFDERDLCQHHLAAVIDILTPFDQDSVLLMVRGMFYYYFLRGDDSGKMLSSNTITYSQSDWPKRPTEFYTEVNGIIFRCDLDFDQEYKHAGSLLDEIDSLRYGSYANFTTSSLAAATAPQLLPRLFIVLRGMQGMDYFAMQLLQYYGNELMQISSTAASVRSVEQTIAKMRARANSDDEENQSNFNNDGSDNTTKNEMINWQWPDIRDAAREINTRVIEAGLASNKRIVLHSGMNKKQKHVQILLDMMNAYNEKFPASAFIPLVIDVKKPNLSVEHIYTPRHESNYEHLDNMPESVHVIEQPSFIEVIEAIDNLLEISAKLSDECDSIETSCSLNVSLNDFDSIEAGSSSNNSSETMIEANSSTSSFSASM